ncbi:YgjP-like metallopeptidase domain-containing protein [Cytobacillus sp. IB215316]|uniref:YgjP-like metallopeptidase domain-containing protein n=1 Tax=Cytobacillus sp. IB215316 TaxID=3097354 RepID=UPI002A1590EB|nr:YgjP-like metallopeptidase domain-containing protein [Cytobacillus sp. IB215316]MDX8360779.1 YgjP-like metallopeptidase domain-containing protein [Cytobacillus sp. IB215316]
MINSKSPIQFNNIALISVSNMKIQYSYFDGYIVLLTVSHVSNASVIYLSKELIKHRKAFINGTGQSKKVGISFTSQLLKASSTCIEYILHHEVAHIKKKDYRKKKYSEMRREHILNGEVYKPELLADAYAKEKMGHQQVSSALAEILKRKQRYRNKLETEKVINKKHLEVLPKEHSQLVNTINSLNLSIKEIEERLKLL